MPESRPKPDHTIELEFGFQASKTLLTAVKLGVVDSLSVGPKTRAKLEAAFDLHPRSTTDFPDALVALRVLDRVDGASHNTPATETYLVSGKPTDIGGILEMANDRLYHFWGELEAALRSGKPTNELEYDQTHPFKEAIYQDGHTLE